MLAVVVTDVEVEGEYEFERRQFGTTPDHLRLLSEWFVEQGVEDQEREEVYRRSLASGGHLRLNPSP